MTAAPAAPEADPDQPAFGVYDAGGDQDPKSPWGRSPLIDRILWEREGRVGPDGTFPPAARMNSFREWQAQQQRVKSLLRQPAAPAAANPGTMWNSIGPKPILNGATANSGRVTAIAVHPTDGNIAYVGAASGGVWKTFDGGVNWIPLTDRQPSLATGAITLMPGNPDTIFVGTGEPNFSCDSYYGVGVLKSTDGGYTWTQLGAAPFANKSISKIVIHPTLPDTMWAATAQGAAGFICGAYGGGGVYKTTDGGVNWSNAGLPGGSINDMVMDRTNPNILYASRNAGGIYKTIDGGTNWTLLAGGLPATGFGRIDLALHPTLASTLYAVYVNSGNNQLGTYKTVDGGTTWTALATMPVNLCNSQCWYNLYIEIAPDGAIWEGGFGIHRSTDDGTSWTSVGGGIHVDQHTVTFGPTGTAWAGNDGGLFTTVNNGAAWTSRSTNLATVQYYPGASVHPTNANFALAGAQDNGTHKFTGASGWNSVFGGDGCATAIDYTNPNNVWYVSYQYLNIYKTVNGSGFAPATSGLADANTPGVAPFIAMFALCPKNAQVLIAGTNNVWRTNDGAATWTANSPDPIIASASIRSVAFDPSDVNCNTYYAGLGSGKIFRTTVGGGAAAGNWVDISTGLPTTRGVSDLAVDPVNPNIVYAAYTGFGAGQQIYKTINALAAAPTWAAASSGLPNAPVNAVLVDPGANTVIYAGSDLGVYRSLDSGTTWTPFMNGHPVVAVYDLEANATTGALISFTHGRGAFKLNAPSAKPVPDGKFIAGLPMRASKGVGANITLKFDNVSCTPGGYNAYWGALTPAALAGYTYSGQECGVASGGDLTTIPAASSAFFVVAGSDGSVTESGNTQDSAGVWRGSGAGRCAITTQSTASTCP